MPATQALARCSSLQILTRSPQQEEATQHILLQTAGQFSPTIESTSPGTVTADLSRKHLPLPKESARQALDSLRGLGCAARAGIAPNPDLALLASHHARPILLITEPQAFLQHLPLRRLSPPPALLQILQSWGIHTAGQLTSLPFAEVTDRLGPAAAALWQLAAGNSQRPLTPSPPITTWRESFDFESPTETLEPILFLLRRFLDALTNRLRTAWLTAGSMSLTILTEHDGSSHRSFTIPSPTTDAALLFRILHTHLESLQLPEPATALSLELQPAPRETSQFSLFETTLRDPNRFSETMARLLALCGPHMAGTPQPANSHRPDHWTIVPPAFHLLKPSAEADPPPVTGLPLRRFRPPIPASVSLLHHQPSHISCPKLQGPIHSCLGPWRSSGHWWEPESTWLSEEWDIAMHDRSLWRIRRAGPAWFLDGCCDAASPSRQPSP
jgi:protein ImuB